MLGFGADPGQLCRGRPVTLAFERLKLKAANTKYSTLSISLMVIDHRLE